MAKEMKYSCVKQDMYSVSANFLLLDPNQNPRIVCPQFYLAAFSDFPCALLLQLDGEHLIGYTRKGFAQSDIQGVEEDDMDYILELWRFSLQHKLVCTSRLPIFKCEGGAGKLRFPGMISVHNFSELSSFSEQTCGHSKLALFRMTRAGQISTDSPTAVSLLQHLPSRAQAHKQDSHADPQLRGRGRNAGHSRISLQLDAHLMDSYVLP